MTNCIKYPHFLHGVLSWEFSLHVQIHLHGSRNSDIITSADPHWHHLLEQHLNLLRLLSSTADPCLDLLLPQTYLLWWCPSLLHRESLRKASWPLFILPCSISWVHCSISWVHLSIHPTQTPWQQSSETSSVSVNGLDFWLETYYHLFLFHVECGLFSKPCFLHPDVFWIRPF